MIDRLWRRALLLLARIRFNRATDLGLGREFLQRYRRARKAGFDPGHSSWRAFYAAQIRWDRFTPKGGSWL